MNNTEVFWYLFVTFLWNLEVIYATLCQGVNGSYCCSGYRWNEIQNNCMPCKWGYTGINCERKCFYPLYGQDCQSTCNCTREECDYIEGCKNSSMETLVNSCSGENGTYCCNGYMWNKEKTKCIPCPIGYHGIHCDTKCPFPSYGNECQLMCTCAETDCDFVSGCTSSLNDTYKNTSVVFTVNSFNRNISNIEDFFSTALDMDDDNANNNCNSTHTKHNKSDGFVGAIIGLAIVACVIILIYLYTYLLEKHQTRRVTV